MAGLTLTGRGLGIQDLAMAAMGTGQILLDQSALAHMRKTRSLIDLVIAEGRPVYGVTTGLGSRATEALNADTLAQFSILTLRGRAQAVGPKESRENIRAAMIVRANTLLLGHSGARSEIAQHIAACLNANITPVVGQIGSIGVADLVLNATMGLALIGEGEMSDPQGTIGPSADVMLAHHIEPLDLGPRDGLAMANSTSAVAGASALAIDAARLAFEAAQTAAAMSLEGFRANLGPLEHRTLAVKPLPGQMAAGEDLRKRLVGSLLLQPGHARRLQDPLSLRNIPQIHGTLSSALSTAIEVAEIEMNGVSDNPIAFLETQEIISCGAYFTSELTNAIEGLNRAFVHLTVAQLARISKLLNPVFSDLTTFLTQRNSGSNGFAPLMKSAEALVSELLHAAQPVPIWPSINANGVEDCVAGSPTAVRALAKIVDYSMLLTAIELIVSCQAVDLREIKPALGPFLTDVYAQIRVMSATLDEDRPLASEVERIAETIKCRKLPTPTIL